jgi:hypothetical protein
MITADRLALFSPREDALPDEWTRRSSDEPRELAALRHHVTQLSEEARPLRIAHDEPASRLGRRGTVPRS